MVFNRRNYYRLLNVQSDASPGVIRAAYRALMAEHHPDAGGDPETAALLNEAYAVLSTPARRVAYDATRAASGGQHVAFDTRKDPVPPPVAQAMPRRRNSGEHGRVTTCHMCNFPVPGPLAADARCQRCSAPLRPVRLSGGGESATDRRSVPRVARTNRARLITNWQAPGQEVQMRDLSTDGMSFHCGSLVAARARIRVACDAFDAVGEVVSARRLPSGGFIIHARMVTAVFAVKTGGFVSRMA